MRRLAPLVFALLAAVVSAQERPRNVILFVGDGFGPAYAELGRQVGAAPLALDAVLVGSAQTAATDAHVTDSAAGATAYSCGIKTYNGAIGVDTTGAPCRTVLEVAEGQGRATGLVTTTRVTHATPASFAAHVPDRDMEQEIALQIARSGVEVLFGGGARFFTPAAIGGARTDPEDLLEQARLAGTAVALTRAEYDALDATPAWALLAGSHLAYDLDRDETDQPALADLTRRASDLLAASPEGAARGFFLLVEGGRIDHAGHDNDPATAAREVLAYDAAVAAALDWARRDGRTLVVGVSDHETGGLTLGCCGVYDWNPGVLAAATESAGHTAARIEGGTPVAEALGSGAGLADPEVAATYALLTAPADGTPALDAEQAVMRLVSARAGIGWTTGGHTAVDINVYAFGPGAPAFAGSRPNSEVGRRLFEALGE